MTTVKPADLTDEMIRGVLLWSTEGSPIELAAKHLLDKRTAPEYRDGLRARICDALNARKGV